MSEPHPNNVQNPYGGQPLAAPLETGKRTLGIWALWTGIASVVIGPIVFGLLSIPPVVLGIIALIKEPRSKALGIWGIVLGVIGFIWMILFWTVVMAWLISAVFVSLIGEMPPPSY